MNGTVDTFMERNRAEVQQIKYVAAGSCSGVNFVLQYVIIAGAGTRAVKGVGLWQLAGWDCGFDSHRGHGCLSVVCCQVEVSATG